MVVVSVLWLCISTVKFLFLFFSFFSCFFLYSICVQCSVKDRLCNMQSLIQLSLFLSPRDIAVNIRRLWKRSAFRRLCQIERQLCVNIFVFIVMFMSVESRCTEHCLREHCYFFFCSSQDLYIVLQQFYLTATSPISHPFLPMLKHPSKPCILYLFIVSFPNMFISFLIIILSYFFHHLPSHLAFCLLLLLPGC